MKSFTLFLLSIVLYYNSMAQCAAPAVTASGSTIICAGGSVTLSTPVVGNVWTQKADFGGTVRGYATGFSIGSKGYIGTGETGTTHYKDFWEYDPATNVWTQKADFGGAGRRYATGFSIGSKGYIGIGYNGTHLKDFWEYDPAANAWTQKSDFGGGARYGAAGFSAGGKGYIGTGLSGAGNQKDFWEYDPATDIWIQKADFGGPAREFATGFSIGSKGYIGTGAAIGSSYKDFWEYDPSTNIWIRKADCGGSVRYNATGFSIGSKGYIGIGFRNEVGYGVVKDFWEYNSAINTWTQKADFGGSERLYATGFSIGGKGYIGTGSGSGGLVKNFWEYDPSYTYSWSPGGETTASITVNTSGNYTVTTTNPQGCSATSIATVVTVSTPAQPTITPSGPATFCEGGSVTLTASASNTWVKKADFGGNGRTGAVSFSIGNKGYIGTGKTSGNISAKDFWEYDPGTDVWTQKADFGGLARQGAAGFSVGIKGYIGTGYKTGNVYSKDFWEYNVVTNTWTQKSDFAGSGRVDATGFSIGSKGYIGTGISSAIAEKDFWEYDPTTDTWTKKADFGGLGRSQATGFSIANKGYLGTGNTNGSTSTKDFWEYDPSTNSWTRKADFGGVVRGQATGFSIVNKGFIGLGSSNGSVTTKDFWEYEVTTDTWRQKADFEGGVRLGAPGFSIGDKGYVALGGTGGGVYLNSVWQYIPQYSYSWAPGGQTTSSILVNAAGSYSVTTTNALGCSATSKAVAVTVYNSTNSAIYVDGSVPASGDGTRWATAYKELRDALYAAGQCSSITAIHVAKGTYKPTDDSNRDSAFTILRGGLKMYGGYPSGGGTRNITTNPTVLSGDIGAANSTSDNSYHIIVIAGLTNAADSVVIDGFTATKANANGNGGKTYNSLAIPQNEGAGIYLHSNNGAAGKIAIRNCIFIANSATEWGGGFYNKLSSPTIINCAFAANTAKNAAGIFNYNSSSPGITNCVFTANIATQDGGGIHNRLSSAPVITNCTIFNNSANAAGAGIYNNGSSPLIRNSVIWSNNGNYPGIYNDNSSTAVTYSIVQEGFAGTGNINADPLFVKSSDADGEDNIWCTADDGLTLSCASPAINKGNNSAIADTVTDITATNPRIQQSTVDIGAYESPYEIPAALAVSISANPGSTVCAGNSVTFTATPVNAGSSTVYQWKKNDIAVGSNNAAYTTNELADGDKISVQLTSSKDCVYPSTASDELSITVNALPQASISYGGSPYCATGTATVTQTGQGGGAYSAASGLVINANTGAINLATSTPGTYMVTYSFTSESCSNTATASVTINVLPQASISYGGSPYCATGTATVTQTGPGGGTYSAASGLVINANTGAINLATSTPGTYMVTYSFTSESCSNTATASVTINALPQASISYGGSPYCATGTATVTQTGQGGGTYSAASGLVINANTGAINLATSTPGTYMVTYSFTSESCSNTATANVTINALPQASISYGGSPYCATGTATVTQTGQGGGTYSAASGLVIDANTGAVNLAASTPGTYMVTYSFSIGSCSNTATANVTINALPQASISYGGSPYCATGTATVTQTGQGGGTYSAASGLVINANTGAVNLAASTPGTYIVEYSFTSGSCSNTATSSVTINALPQASISYSGSPYCATGTATVTQTGQGGGTYSAASGLVIDANTGAVNLAASTPGTYIVEYSFISGSCSNTATSSVTINALPQASISYGGSPYCATGTATVTQTGQGGGIYSAASGLVIDANTGAVNLAASTPGTYMVTYSFSIGSCSNTATANVTINALPQASISYGGSPYCATGTATVTQTGQGGGTYSAASGLVIDANTGAINLATSTPGTYIVTYSFTSESCSNTAMANVMINALPQASISYGGSPYCATGTATVTQTGQGGGTYRAASGLVIDANTGAVNLAASTPGTYMVTYSFSIGSCSNTTTANITINALAQASISYGGSPYCATGTATVMQTGQGSGTYSAASGLKIDANTGAVNLAASTPGTYMVTYSFSIGSCSNTTTANITINALAQASISYSGSPFCPAGTASVKLTGQGGGTYSSTTGLMIDANTGEINLATSTPGTYMVTYRSATGACGSTATTSITIKAFPVTVTAGTITCNGGLATITVKATGTGSLKYKLSGGLSFQISNIFIVAAGTYTITVQDANGCSGTSAPITITQPPSIIKSLTAGTINCYGGTTTLSVTAGDGVAPYTYALDNASFQSSSSFTAGAGTHIISVKDSKGCVAVKSITINQPSAISVDVSAAAILCTGGTTTVTVSATGGTPGYTGTGMFTKGAGTYTFTVKDAKGCTGSKTITITQPASAVTLTLIQKINVSCLNGSNGSIKVNATGGTSPYKYNLNNGAYGSSNTFSSLKAGTYTVNVKDAIGCIKSLSVVINNGTGNCNNTLSVTNATLSGADISNDPWLKAVASPNPSIAEFTLTLNGNSNEPVDVRVIDMFGRPVYQSKGSANQSYKFGERFAGGVYIVEILQGKLLKTIKIVKGN